MKHLLSPIQWMIHLMILPFIVSSISCTSPGKIRERNRNNLSRLTLDMSRQQVLTVMKRPYRSETLSLSNGKRLELLYYHTDLKTPDGAVTDDELRVFDSDGIRRMVRVFSKMFGMYANATELRLICISHG